MERPAGLPDYLKPPLVEVALGVQFEPIEGFSATHFGPVADELRADYPVVEDKPPLQPAFELPRAPLAASIEAQALDFVLPRIWMISADSTRLVQFQTDRFISNWRLAGEGGEYPRYEAMRDGFTDAYGQFEAAIGHMGFPRLSINQVEVTYINRLSVEGDAWSCPEHFLCNLSGDGWSDEAATLETVRGHTTHRLENPDGSWAGRMHTVLRPGNLNDGQRVLTLAFTVRGKPAGDDAESALAFMDFGREKIVNRFTAVTRSERHAEWGRKD